ncbi:hypothetical protein ACT4UT_33445, partial [Bacillus sp. B-TM1]
YTLNPDIYTTSMGTIENTNSSCNIRNFPITEVSVKFNGREKINFIEFKLNNGTLVAADFPTYIQDKR